MGRKVLVTTMVGAALVLVAGPATAKGITAARFTGPGLPPGGITIRGDRPELLQTGVVEQDRSYWTPWRMGISRADLGPAYQVTFSLDPSIARHWTLHQTLYPYARKAGVWSYTPAGQRLGPRGAPISPGWYSNDDSLLMRFLVAHGFPAHPPVRAVSTTGAGTSSVGMAAVWGGVGFAAMLGLLGVAVRRRRTETAPGLR